MDNNTNNNKNDKLKKLLIVLVIVAVAIGVFALLVNLGVIKFNFNASISKIDNLTRLIPNAVLTGTII